MKKAIIFDLYDTLITIPKKTKPYFYLLSHVDPKTNIAPYIINHIMTEDLEPLKVCREMVDVGVLSSSFDETNFLALLDMEVENAVVFPDTHMVLKRLKEKYRLFLLSNLSTPYKYPYYKLDLVDYFERAFFSCECKDKKPNASFYQKILDYSLLNKEDFIMIGDNPISDFKGATDFGIDVILKDKRLEEITKHL